ncbi:hypothetical protein L208DRAFT_1338945 [Tricholoma matsutake]|nr:hypothetical protein L208DRAFT_1338945 [Tricholoma matsutake 945]
MSSHTFAYIYDQYPNLKHHSTLTDPLVHHGHHFGRTIHALCHVHTLLMNGILREVELADRPDESFTAE